MALEEFIVNNLHKYNMTNNNNIKEKTYKENGTLSKT